ncbi:MAG: 3-dehydroquinate synthase [Anaerolineae bacterium]|nr:3-dehydroquinate synthase [Thermoflexales bacterium]MDW8406171.1 3-dehydroquinate synthase [Anaerolineae bacterium]
MSKPLILAGFMGAGKTTIGQLAARRLGYHFIDTDAEIERRAGLTIPQLFDQYGEAHFRALEVALVNELATRTHIVVATGGGTVVNPTNRAALLQSGVVVCLTASPEAILRRVDASTRPMLRVERPGENIHQRVAHLLEQRAPAYAELHYHLDTTHRTVEEAAQLALDIYHAEHERIAVRHPAGRYDIVIGERLIDQLGFALAGRGWASPLAIVSDHIVGALYAERVQHALRRAGLDSFVYLMPAGESHKTLRTVEDMYQAFAAGGLERNSAVIALGGGVVGDVAGFAAATYMRGIGFVQVPTSLLAMADSSIGGKVGVDLPFGKNLVGAFKQPDGVFIDLDLLNSLPVDELQCGYAEIVKAALLRGGAAWERVQQLNPEDWRLAVHPDLRIGLRQTLLDAILLKREVVEEDPFERGRRALLNLGHTFGHGIEAWSRFTIKHGQAVALGMVCAMRLARAIGLCDPALTDAVTVVLQRAGLPTSLPAIEAEAVWELMQTDKKKRGKRLRFALLRAPGDALITDSVDERAAKAALASLKQASP